ncbi:putative porin [uncultured Maribacter sp.]|uniref:putative porin n=1 Tax=uncultured Maribacter sp. TaxID=431308 RepID=UPI00261AEA12|nr:putative porin [uncultured Maribacter sp.]
MKYYFSFFLICFATMVSAQTDSIISAKKIDTVFKKTKPRPKNKLSVKEGDTLGITIKDYKIITYARDTTYLDTTLTIQKEFKYNYLRKDDFELMPFANVGQPYTKLGVNFNRATLYPRLGAKAKHFNYAEVEDIKYYNVATPMTDLFFKTTFEQGQLLDAMLTFNTSRRLNFSLGFKGFRSLGKYQINQAESGNFKATTNYLSRNNRYNLIAHIAAQDIVTEENGGLADAELQFASGDPDFSDRGRLDVLFVDAKNKVLGKRYFLEHNYKLLRKSKDSSRVEKTSLALAHTFNYETKYYQYMQDEDNSYFGEAFLEEVNDKAVLKTMYNQVGAQFYNATLGKLEGNISLYNYNYNFNSVLVKEDKIIPSQLKGEEISLGGNYKKQIGGFNVTADIKYTISGNLTGNIFNGSARYSFNPDTSIKFGIHSSSRMPDFNQILYQSEHLNYNWYNTEFEKEKVNNLNFELKSKKWGLLEGNLTTLNKYTYFKIDPEVILEDGVESIAVKPFQEGNSVNHIKVKYQKEIRLGKFALNNTIMYQNVAQTNQVLNVPELVTRNTLYFSSDVFKKAMYIQTGITFKYFSSYSIDAYNPLLGEFYIQNTESLGGYPLLDFFINAKVQQTRIYLKAEHFNSSFGKTNSHYAAPNYPYRDFVIRFGLVWNFFS